MSQASERIRGLCPCRFILGFEPVALWIAISLAPPSALLDLGSRGAGLFGLDRARAQRALTLRRPRWRAGLV